MPRFSARAAGATSRSGSNQLERAALTAVHDDRRPADPARSWRGQERNHVTDFVSAAEAPEWQLTPDELGDRCGILPLPLPPRATLEQNRSRRYAVDADVGRGQLRRQRFREADLGCLDRVVGHASTGLAAEYRRDDDDRS